MTEKLFKEFPPVLTQQWEEQIRLDLKGADYEKKLVWKTTDGFRVRPYYREEDLKGIPHLDSLPGQKPYLRGTAQRFTFTGQRLRAGSPEQGRGIHWLYTPAGAGAYTSGHEYPV